jgi:hypothetical protein
MANGMWLHVRRLIQSVLRAEHPEWCEAAVDCETARRLLHGPDATRDTAHIIEKVEKLHAQDLWQEVSRTREEQI